MIFSLSCILILFIIIVIIYIRLKGLKIRSLQLENEKLKLREEKRLSEYIREKQSNELESMKRELGVLESEKEQITEILSEERKVANSIRIAMKNRLGVLNGLIAAKISSNDKYSIAYKELEHTVENDKSSFLKSIQSTLEETNPQFMNLLHEKGLTEMEIKCVCLLALGLKASEIGRYLGTARHYNLSSSIRKKLGLDSKDMNIGQYIKSKVI